MRGAAIIAILSFPVFVYSACSWDGWNADPTAIFSDLSYPHTLTEIEIYTWENCTQVVTALATLFVGAAQFTANPNVFTFYNATATPTPIFVTYEFPGVTLTSFLPGEEVTWSETVTGTDAEVNGGVQYIITIPPNAATASASTATATATVTAMSTIISTTSVGSGGVAPAIVGGIAAGIVGGFLLLGALVFFILFRKPAAAEPAPTYYQDPHESKRPYSANINDGGERMRV